MLIGFSLLVALSFLGAFIRAVKSGQYKDCYTPAIRMLFDDSRIESSVALPKQSEEKRYVE